ncbi:hypothetical protein F4777DRAFT_244819 [Nemania sp. FL0916]|nr:hypothetical protein F4777DRAFT_244819 [Nemania sp. FL0916]
MSPKNRVSRPCNGVTCDVKVSLCRQVWYCDECGHGPLNPRLDEICTVCSKRQSGCSHLEWVPIQEEEPVPFIRSRPKGRGKTALAAPPLVTTTAHVSTYTCAIQQLQGRAVAEPQHHSKTPWTVISDAKHAKSPLAPCPVEIGTSTGPSTQSETTTQQSNQPVSEHRNAGVCENDLSLPFAYPFHDPLSLIGDLNYDDIGHFDSLNEVTAYCDSGLDLDCFLHSVPSGCAINLENTKQASPSGILAQIVAIDACASNRGSHAIPVVPSGRAADAGLTWPGFSIDVSNQAAISSQVRDQLARPAHLPWVSDGDHNAQARHEVPLVDHNRPESPVLSGKPSSISQTPKKATATNSVSKQYECCKSSESQELACPFYKYDPQKYIGCFPRKFKNIGRLGQHLKLSHKLRPNRCPSCWRSFDTADSLTRHKPCMPTGGVSVEGLDPFPKNREMHRDQKWYWAWRKLFGEAAAPACPFHQPIEDIAARLQPRGLKSTRPKMIPNDTVEHDNSPGFQEMSLPTSFDWHMGDDTAFLGINDSMMAGLPPGEFQSDASGSSPSADISPSIPPSESDFHFDDFDIGLCDVEGFSSFHGTENVDRPW